MDDSPIEHKKRKHKKTAADRPIEVLDAGLVKLPSHSPLADRGPEHIIEDDTLSIWVQLEGCDPAPVTINGDITVHDLKLLLGGFHSASPSLASQKLTKVAQRQQIELLGLVGIRPQQLKLKVENNALSPSSLLRTVVSEGTTVQLSIVQSPVTSALTASSSTQSQAVSTDPETHRFMNSIRHEVDYLRRRVLAPSVDLRSSNSAIDAALPLPSSSAVTSDMYMGSTEAVNRLEALEAKLDLKNSTWTFTLAQ